MIVGVYPIFKVKMKSVVTLRLINFLVQILKCTKTIILFVFLPMKMLDKQTQK